MAEKAEWAKMKPEEVEKLIVELGKKGNAPEKIGLILRDQHGIPKAKLFGKKISKVLAEHKLPSSSEQKNLKIKIETLGKHATAHKHDYTAKRKGVMYAARLKKIEMLAAQ